MTECLMKLNRPGQPQISNPLDPWENQGDAISVVSGEFSDIETEKAYLESTWDDLNKRQKTTAFIASLFSLISLYLDFLYLGASISFGVLMAARVIGVIPLVHLSLFASESNSKQAILHSTFWAINCVFSSVLASVYILPEATLLASLWVSALALGNYTFVPHTFGRRVVSSLYLSVGFISISFFHKDVGKENFISAIMFLSFTNALGTQFSRALEGFRRKEASLLQTLLPSNVIQSLKLKKKPIEVYENVTVLFADLVGFTELTSRIHPEQLVASLNRLFSEFDEIIRIHRAQKIKTIGDCYMAVSGLPTNDAQHAKTMLSIAIEMRRVVRRFIIGGKRLQLRIGVHSGPVIAGVIGKDRPFFDVWGETVNIASRMESHGLANHIQVSHSTYKLTKDMYRYTSRGDLLLKNVGEHPAYLLSRSKPPFLF